MRLCWHFFCPVPAFVGSTHCEWVVSLHLSTLLFTFKSLFLTKTLWASLDRLAGALGIVYRKAPSAFIDELCIPGRDLNHAGLCDQIALTNKGSCLLLVWVLHRWTGARPCCWCLRECSEHICQVCHTQPRIHRYRMFRISPIRA